MVRMQIQFTSEQSAELRRQARMRGISLSAFVREAVDRELHRSETREDTWVRALAAIGCGHSGVGDIAEKHDEYLVDAYAND